MFFKKYNLLLLIVIILNFAATLKAERLPLRLYTSADGLSSAAIFQISRDSRGFLWFSTRDGLSRFDGREFVNYRFENEKTPIFNATTETRDGTFWIAASGGIYRVNPETKDNDETETIAANNDQANGYRNFRAEKVSAANVGAPLFEDSRGRLWAAGAEPYLIAENDELKLQQFDLGAAARFDRGSSTVAAINETADGSVWFGCDAGAMRLLPDGRRILYPIKKETAYNETRSILFDEAGNVWIGHQSGVFVFRPETLAALADAPDQSRREFAVEEKIVRDSASVSLPNESGKMLRLRFSVFATDKTDETKLTNIKTAAIDRIFKTFDGQIWIPAAGNLFIYERGEIERLSDTNGFPGAVQNFVEDFENNVWIATEGGALKYNRGGFTSWSQADGLPDSRVHSFSAAQNGELYVVHGNWRVTRLIQNRIESAQLHLPDGERYLWTSPAAIIDRENNWWALTAGGLYRFADGENLSQLNGRKPDQVFGRKDDFPSDSFYAAYEDSGGNLWVSTRGAPETNTLARRDAITKEWRFFSEADNYPKGAAARSFVEDAAGNLWIGFYGGGFVRYKNNRFTDFSNQPNAPKGGILALHVDVKRRLWIGSTEDGLNLVENPGADELNFKRFTAAEGLTSNNVRSMTSDLNGNVYVGTIRGVDRLNPETGSVRHYTTIDGLASDNVTAARRDLSGALWFGTANGLSKLEPTEEAISKPSNLRVLINSLQIAGKDRSISDFGRDQVENLSLSAAENNLQIQFLSVGSNLRYQYKLESGEEKDWSRPTAERIVTFAGLAPGAYRFSVRAVDSDNRTSEKPALVSFTIAQPFWKTWQFIGSIILLAGLGVFLLDRFRVAKTKQVRTALARSQASEQIAKESETRFRTLAQTASDAIITIDDESRIVFVNDAAEETFGFGTKDLIGKDLTVLMPEEFRNRHHAGLKRYVSENQKNISWSGVELIGRHKTGALIPLEVSFGEFELDGKRYFTGVARDISERKRHEELIQKAREDRLKELQKVRARIATDLHDDIGSSLTQIAVLSEVARASAIKSEVKMPLERISAVSNELVDAMADIVWAINPKKDSWRELVLRMRRFASDVLSARDIEFELETPDTEQNITLGANIRREVFSIFKELINNIVRHSGASEVALEFEIIVGVLRLRVADNGQGFDAARILSDEFTPDKGGNGLVNVRRRVSDLNGTCEIKSSKSGTTIELFIPLQKEHEAVSITIRADGGNSNGNKLH